MNLEDLAHFAINSSFFANLHNNSVLDMPNSLLFH